jgi:sensor domain CHASE-containing protein
MLLIYNLKGEFVAGSIVDLEEEQPIVCKSFPHDKLPAEHLLMSSEIYGKSLSGLMQTEHGPMIVSAQKILKSDGEGPSRGILIMGRLLNVNRVEKISRQTFVDLDTLSLQTDPINAELSDIIEKVESSTGNVFMSPESADLLNANTVRSVLDEKKFCKIDQFYS